MQARVNCMAATQSSELTENYGIYARTQPADLSRLWNDLFPVLIGFLPQTWLVLVPGFQRVVAPEVVKKEKLAIDDLECFRIDFHLLPRLAHCICTPTAVHRLIFFGAGLELTEVCRAREIVSNPLVGI